MAKWEYIVEDADDRDPCDRCGGKGKVPLFSSVEDPCRKCDGSGILPLSDDDNDSDNEDGDNGDGDGGSSQQQQGGGNTTKQSVAPPALLSFLDHQKTQAVKQKSQFARSRIDDMPLGHPNPPDQADLNSLVGRFQTDFCAHAKRHPKTSFPFNCVSAPKPQIFFRRAKNANVNLNLSSRASSFRVFTCWNMISKSPPDVIPQNTLVVVSFVPLQCAVYCQW